jgi:divalent metal cation (Fe/Co/Zn/Cd) transporter
MRNVPGVRRVETVRLRRIGHRMRAETELTVDNTLSAVQAHAIADEAHRQLTDSR